MRKQNQTNSGERKARALTMWRAQQHHTSTNSLSALRKPQYTVMERIWFIAILLLGAGLAYAVWRTAGPFLNDTSAQNTGLRPSPQLADFKTLLQQIRKDPANIKAFATKLDQLEPAAQQVVLKELTNSGKDEWVIDSLMLNIRAPFSLLQALHDSGIIDLNHNRFLLQRLTMLHGYHEDKLANLLTLKPDLSAPYIFKGDEEGQYNGTVLHSLIINEVSSARIVQILDYAKQHGLKINFAHRDKLGKTVLMMAVRMGASNTVKAILENPEAKATIGSVDPNTGMTELHYACLIGDYESAAALIKAGADVNAVDKKGHSPFDYLLTGTERIKAAFKKMLIDSERDEGADFNGIGLFDADCACHALIPIGPPFTDTLKTTGPTSQGQQQLLLGGATGFALMCKHNQVVFENQLMSMLPFTPEQKQNLKDRFKEFTGRSLLQRALDNRPRIALLLLESGINSQVVAEKVTAAIIAKKVSAPEMTSLRSVEETVRGYIDQYKP